MGFSKLQAFAFNDAHQESLDHIDKELLVLLGCLSDSRGFLQVSARSWLFYSRNGSLGVRYDFIQLRVKGPDDIDKQLSEKSIALCRPRLCRRRRQGDQD